MVFNVYEDYNYCNIHGTVSMENVRSDSCHTRRKWLPVVISVNRYAIRVLMCKCQAMPT